MIETESGWQDQSQISANMHACDHQGEEAQEHSDVEKFPNLGQGNITKNCNINCLGAKRKFDWEKSDNGQTGKKTKYLKLLSSN